MVKIKNLKVGKEPIFLCSIVENNVARTVAQAKKAMKNGANCLELRIDALEDRSMIKDVINKLKDYPKLIVCRPTILDGYFKGSGKERADWLLEALNYSPDAVDIEYAFLGDSRIQNVMDTAKSNGIPVLICYEDFVETPSKEDLLDILKDEQKLGADIAKFAVMANSPRATLNVLQTALEAKQILKIPYIAIAMGKDGSISRPYSLILGASMTYCAVEKGKEGAPGQLPVKDTKRMYELLKSK